MLGKAKLKAEIMKLEYRVAELEDRLCPGGIHDFVKIGHEVAFGLHGMESCMNYKCKKCGKVKTRYDRSGFTWE